MKSVALFACIFVALTAFAQMAGASGVNCAGGDPQSQVFEKYNSFSDERIIDDCTFDILAAIPGVTAARLRTNQSRTSKCVKSVEKMREISRAYLAEKKSFCQMVGNNPGCGGSQQADCLLSGGKLSAGAQRKHAALSSLLGNGVSEMEELQRYTRLRSKKYKEDLKALQSVPPNEKKNPSLLTNKPGDHGREPAPSQPQPPPRRNPPESGISGDPKGDPKAGPRADPKIDPRAEVEPPGEIRARYGGASTLAEYEKRLPYLIRESETNLKNMEEFEKVSDTNRFRHLAAAKEMASRAADLFFSAEKLGAVDEEMKEWQEANADVVRERAKANAQAQRGETGMAGKGEPAESSKLAAGIAAEEKDESDSASEEKAESPSEENAESVLQAFETKLEATTDKEDSEVARARLKELLRLRLAAARKGEEQNESESVAGNLVKDLIAETAELAQRGPGSVGGEDEGIGTLDVNGALRDIESQLRELDRQNGILESESISLFERVRASLKRSYKSGSVGKRKP